MLIDTRVPSRRRHPAELKDKVLAACEGPGASVAAVAQAHGLNANLVHKWRRRREAERRLAATAGAGPGKRGELTMPAAAGLPARALAAETVLAAQPLAASGALTAAAASFVPVQLRASLPAPADIRLELRRGAATVVVTWPVQEAAACGSWLREWLR